MLRASLQLYRNAYSGIPASVWWLSLVMLVNRSGTMVIPFLTVYLTHSGYTLAEAGSVMAFFGAGAIVGGYLGGVMTDKLGFFWVQVVSLFLSGVLFIVLGYMQTYWQLALCIFILASFGEAFRPANGAAIAAYSTDSNRTRCYSLNRLAVNLGWAVGPAVGGLLASINYGLLFWVDGITCIIAAVLLYGCLQNEGKRPGIENKSATVKTGTPANTDRYFLLVMGFLLLVGICFFQLFSMVTVYYKEDVHLSEAMIGWILASNGLIIVLIEMVLVYKLEAKRSAVFYIVWGTFLIAFSFLLLSFTPSLPMVILSMLAVTFGEMLLFPFINTFWVSRSNAGNRGQYAAYFTMTFALSQVLSPVIASPVAMQYGFPLLFTLDFVLCSLAAFGFLWVRKKV